MRKSKPEAVDLQEDIQKIMTNQKRQMVELFQLGKPDRL